MSYHNIIGDNDITIKNKISHNNTIMLLGKTFSFMPDETNVDDLEEACDLLIIYSVIENPDLCIIYQMSVLIFYHACYIDHQIIMIMMNLVAL